MFSDHLISFSDYLIEESSICKTYLIPGKKFYKILDWFGKERLNAFKGISKHSPSLTDLDENDEYYEHMILWDPAKNQLIGGQRFKFNISKYDDTNSYFGWFISYLSIYLWQFLLCICKGISFKVVHT